MIPVRNVSSSSLCSVVREEADTTLSLHLLRVSFVFYKPVMKGEFKIRILCYRFLQRVSAFYLIRW